MFKISILNISLKSLNTTKTKFIVCWFERFRVVMNFTYGSCVFSIHTLCPCCISWRTAVQMNCCYYRPPHCMAGSTLLFKSNGIFFLRWQNMVFIFKVQTWNFVCGIRRSFAFTMENILSVWYTATPGWTSKFGKVWKTRYQNAATRANIWRCFLFHEMTNTYEWWSAIIDTNYIFVANYYAFPVYIFFGQIRYLNIRHERTLTSSPLMLKCSERCRETQEREPAHTGWCPVIQPQKYPRYFEIGS